MKHNPRIKKYSISVVDGQHYMVYPSGKKRPCYFYPCKECGKELMHRGKSEKIKTTGLCRVCANIGHRNPNSKNLSSYVVHKQNDGRKIREHVAIFEKELGRKLKPGEQIHHIDNDPRNNKRDNLVLCKSSSEHLKIHRQLESIAFDLFASGLIKFDHKNKTYYVDQ